MGDRRAGPEQAGRHPAGHGVCVHAVPRACPRFHVLGHHARGRRGRMRACPRDHREPRCPFGPSHQQGGHQSVRPARAGGERQAEPRERLPGARGGQGDVHMGAAPRRIRL